MRWLVIAIACLAVSASSRSQTDALQKQSIQGKVVEAKSGQPIRKVNIQVMGGAGQSSGPHSGTTAADGTFTIEDLPPGRYFVTLEHAGFVHATNRQETFTLQPAQSLTGLVFRMQAAGVISGKIVDPDGDPMAGVSVSATMIGTAPAVGRFRAGAGGTNDLGEYRIADLRPGKYLISAQPSQRPAPHAEGGDKAEEHLIYAPTYYPGALDKVRAVGVDLRSGEEAVANFGVLTSHAYRVSGTVAGVPSGAMAQLILFSKSGGGAMDSQEQLKEGSRFEYQNFCLAPIQ